MLEAFSQVFITGWHDGHLCACIACHQFPLTDCMQVWLYTKPCCTRAQLHLPDYWKRHAHALAMVETIFLCLSACRLWRLCSSVAFCLCLCMHSSKLARSPSTSCSASSTSTKHVNCLARVPHCTWGSLHMIYL